MGFAIEGKPWRPPRKPKDFLSKSKAPGYAVVEPNGVHVRCCYPSVTLLTPKEARRLATFLVNAANYIDGKYVSFVS